MLLYLAPANMTDPEELVEWSQMVNSNLVNVNFDTDKMKDGLDIYVGF